jgi:FdhD protein
MGFMDREVYSANATLAVLAGGRGTRMGQPKSLLRIGDKPILQYLLDEIRWPGATVLGSSPRLPHPPGWEKFDRVVVDDVEGQGPLRGILNALRKCNSSYTAVITCDMPAIRRQHLEYLISRLGEHADRLALMLRRGEVIEPFPFVCRSTAADAIARHLESGNASVHSLAKLAGFEIEEAPADWPAPVWTNLNTPDDLDDFTAAHTKVLRWRDGKATESIDELAQEEPLEIRVRGRAISVSMRTPGHDDELAAGFLLTEGIIHEARDILNIEPCSRNEHGNTINVQLAPDVAVDFDRLTRHVFAASSCGLCGKATIDSIRSKFPAIDSNAAKIDAKTLTTLPAIMRQSQQAFERTGGIHAAAIFDATGNLLVVREDVGRHNAVDKVIGHALRSGWLPLNHHILLVSSRAGFEIMQKSLAAGVAIVAAVSAPSNLAVQFAKENHQTLVGFLRGDRMNVYSANERFMGWGK